MAHKKNLAVDLDGTLFKYDKFRSWDHFGEPNEGIVELLMKVKEAGWNIIIWTVRQETEKMKEHLAKYNIPYDYINWQPWPKDGSRKIAADVYLDDRGIRFDGKTEGLLEQILNFKPWFKEEK